MKEVTRLAYDLASDTILATVSVVKESEHVPGAMVRQLGVPEPTASIRLDELPSEAQTAFRALASALIPLVEQRHGALVADPEKVAAKAAELAGREQQIASERRQADEDVARRQAEASTLDKEIARRRAEAAMLDEALATKKKALDRAEAEKKNA